jgi:hypothetical protein
MDSRYAAAMRFRLAAIVSLWALLSGPILAGLR